MSGKEKRGTLFQNGFEERKKAFKVLAGDPFLSKLFHTISMQFLYVVECRSEYEVTNHTKKLCHTECGTLTWNLK